MWGHQDDSQTRTSLVTQPVAAALDQHLAVEVDAASFGAVLAHEQKIQTETNI
ncbi:MAG: hypothetical protein ABIP82_01385 [Nitrospirales bacterium]